MWIDFEGIDGSGKTSVSGRTAELLRARGLPVVHAREGGDFASAVAGRVRDLARSVDSLRLAPEAELLLNLAREAQIVSEIVRPALARGCWVITDRTVYSHLGLARRVRGIGGAEAEAAARLSLQGLAPDLVILVDVDPDVARWRRRIRKIRERRLGDSGRKGLAGERVISGTQEAFREGASRDGWVVLDNTWRSLEETAAAAVAAIDGDRRKAAAGFRAFEADPGNLTGSFLDFAEGVTDDSLAATLAAGLDHPRADALRRRGPADVAAHAASGMDSEAAWALREELRGASPYYVARSLRGLEAPRAWRLRRDLEPLVPDQVLHSLSGQGDEAAHALRERRFEESPGEAVRSTRGLGDERAWALRRRAEAGAPLAESLAGLDCPASWRIREELRAGMPLAVLKSLRGSRRPEAWDLRREWPAFAPKTVLDSIAGMDDGEAWELRRSLRGTAPEETAASLSGLDGPEAWRWREDLAEAAPVGVLKSLGGLSRGRAEGLVGRLVARFPRRLRVAREAIQWGMNSL